LLKVYKGLKHHTTTTTTTLKTKDCINIITKSFFALGLLKEFEWIRYVVVQRIVVINKLYRTTLIVGSSDT